MQRRDFVKFVLLGSCTTVLKTSASTKNISLFTPFSKPLSIPPILEPKLLKNGVKEYFLNVQEGEVAFLNGVKTKTYGVNADFLGPTISVQRNDTIKINVKNSLKETTILHWHGLKVPGVNDGGPNREIIPNDSWTTEYKINQRSSLCWYHPHTHEKTAIQVYKGIAGLFIIEDEESLKITLPKEYGVNDIPLIFQDRRFNHNGQFLHKQSMRDIMMGVTGNIFLINGVINPYLEVNPTLIRFRILNGSNARFYSFIFSDNRTFYQIAGDSSLLPKPVSLKRLILSPGERAEIVVDLSNLAGKEIFFKDSLKKTSLLKIKVKNVKREPFILPKKLTTITEYKNLKNVHKREFILNMRHGWLGINGKQMNMKRIDEKVILGQIEIWTIKNPNRMPHPFHIHGCSFKILSRNSRPALLNESGLKDTVLLYGRETVKIAIQFEYEATKNYPYMYHCHILEHEDAGMMGQFTVTKKER